MEVAMMSLALLSPAAGCFLGLPARLGAPFDLPIAKLLTWEVACGCSEAGCLECATQVAASSLTLH